MNSRWSHCVEKGKLKKGPWTFEEDIRLLRYIRLHGDGRWSALAKAAGLQRCGKSCRLRWVNYLRPGIKRGNITPEEERVIIDLHARWGNRWSLIAEKIPGRTDNEIKNYWRSHLKKKLQKATTEDTQNDGNVDVDRRSIPQPPGMPQLQAQDKDNHSLLRQTDSFQISKGVPSNPCCSYDNHHGVNLDIPAASPFTSHEIRHKSRTPIHGIPLKDAETDNDEVQFCTQSSFMESSVKEPRIEKDTGPQTEAHALPPTPILCSFPWEIPIENDVFQADFSYSNNSGGDQQLHAPYEFESDAGLDIWPDLILWNLCPFSVVELDQHLL